MGFGFWGWILGFGYWISDLIWVFFFDLGNGGEREGGEAHVGCVH